MKKISKILPVALIALPLVATAEEVAEQVVFVNSISLWVAIVMGLITSFMVLTYARRIGGGILQKVYYSFGVGMICIVLGSVAVVIPPWAPAFVILRIHDVLFILGTGLMAIGAGKLLEAAK